MRLPWPYSTSLLALLLVFLESVVFPQDTVAFRNLDVGQNMPHFKAARMSGGTFDSAGLEGKVSVLFFFKPHQPNSKKALADLQTLFHRYKERGVAFVAISVDTNGKGATGTLAKELGITFPFLLDPGRDVYGTFGLIVSPTTAIFDKTMVFRYYEPIHAPRFRTSVDLALQVLLGDKTDAERTKILTGGGSKKPSADQKKAKRKLSLARMMLKRHHLERALQIAREALALDPDLAAAHAIMGEGLLLDGKPKEALEKFALAQEKGATAEEIQKAVATALAGLGEKELTSKLAADLAPKKTSLLQKELDAALAAKQAKDEKKAVAHFEKAAKIVVEGL